MKLQNNEDFFQNCLLCGVIQTMPRMYTSKKDSQVQCNYDPEILNKAVCDSKCGKSNIQKSKRFGWCTKVDLTK